MASTQILEIHLPDLTGAGPDQDGEWCEIETPEGRRRIRFHDYDEIFAIPGLYEQLFYDVLECRSPQTVCALRDDKLHEAGADAGELTVFDVGAGNGMVGEELARLGAGSIVGVDIIEEAAVATRRDRPHVYDDYFVLDLTRIPDGARDRLEQKAFNCLTSVAALGFGDIPPRAFAEAHNLVADGGWIAFTIKEDFLGADDGTGFSRLVERMLDAGTLELRGRRRYRHRLSTAGDPLHYVAMVAQKRADVPPAWTDQLGDGRMQAPPLPDTPADSPGGRAAALRRG
jgi:predicted TPR repeat methyltransferase